MISQSIFILIGAYMVGSVPFGLLIAKAKGVDIREHGSGNIGATNVFRVCGKVLGVISLVLDVLKGLVPVLLVQRFATDDSGLLSILTGVATILGHNFPCWLKFKGGKGIATSAGVLGGLLPWTLLGGLAAWAVGMAATRYVSVASIMAAVSLPITTAYLTFFRPHGLPIAYLIFTIVIASLAIWRHRSNIQRLRAGTENRFAPGPKP